MKLLKVGLHPAASHALESIGIEAAQVGQTIGRARASAGTHASDGQADGHPYCAAVDLRVEGLEEAEIRTLLGKLGTAGFAAWYRQPGHDHWPADQVAHVHAVYAACRMKRILRDQVHDWLHGKNGLRSHAVYEFLPPAPAAVQVVRSLFLEHNPATS